MGLAGKCPASPALEGGVPACRQAGRGTKKKDFTLPGSHALQGVELHSLALEKDLDLQEISCID
jgi:hypothetical protein